MHFCNPINRIINLEVTSWQYETSILFLYRLITWDCNKDLSFFINRLHHPNLNGNKMKLNTFFPVSFDFKSSKAFYFFQTPVLAPSTHTDLGLYIEKIWTRSVCWHAPQMKLRRNWKIISFIVCRCLKKLLSRQKSNVASVFYILLLWWYIEICNDYMTCVTNMSH